jgi:hypothetical protein
MQTNECGIVPLLQKYIKPLTQCLTNDFPQFDMRMQVTKCVNTGIMLGFFMVGKTNMTEIVEHCNTLYTRQRYKTGILSTPSIFTTLEEDITSSTSIPMFYYILITDAVIHNVYFPGHVFIIKHTPENKFHVYQSYIGEYDLNHSVEKILDIKGVNMLIKDLQIICTSIFWDSRCVDAWKRITSIDTYSFMGLPTQGNLLLCFKKAPIENCIEGIKSYALAKQKEIYPLLQEGRGHEIYGNVDLYDEKQTPLTNLQIYTSVKNIAQYTYDE